MSESAQDPQTVAAHLLDDQRMIAACATHNVQQIISLLVDHGASMGGVARALGISVGRVAEFSRGRRQPSSFELFERISDGLRIPGRYLRLAGRPWEE